MTRGLIIALSLFATSAMAAPPPPVGEPLPPGAPTDPFELTAWCYGALGEYLSVYDQVKPDLRDIDKMFGTPVQEDEPYQSDMAAARVELTMIGDTVHAAEKSSRRPISAVGAASIRQGAGIWSGVEAKTHRELARAWLTWALPDRCDSVAREVAARTVGGRAYSYTGHGVPTPAPNQALPVETAPAEAVAPPPQSPADQPPAQQAAAQPVAPPSAQPDTPPPSETAVAAPPSTTAPATAANTTNPSDQSSEPTL